MMQTNELQRVPLTASYARTWLMNGMREAARAGAQQDGRMLLGHSLGVALKDWPRDRFRFFQRLITQ